MFNKSQKLKAEPLTNEQQVQQAAIYNGLLSIFTQVEANIALEKWAKYFVETGSVFNGVNSFARDICESSNKSGQHRELVKAINFELMSSKNPITINPNKRQPKPQLSLLKDTQSLKLSPFSMTLQPVFERIDLADTSVDQLTSFHQVINTPDFQTFQLLFLKVTQLLLSARPNLRSNLNVFLNELVASMPWADAQQQQMMDVINTGQAQQKRAYKADQLKTFLKHFRTWIAAETSVQDADKLLNEAIIEVELTAAGALYSAKAFI